MILTGKYIQCTSQPLLPNLIFLCIWQVGGWNRKAKFLAFQHCAELTSSQVTAHQIHGTGFSFVSQAPKTRRSPHILLMSSLSSMGVFTVTSVGSGPDPMFCLPWEVVMKGAIERWSTALCSSFHYLTMQACKSSMRGTGPGLHKASGCVNLPLWDFSHLSPRWSLFLP